MENFKNLSVFIKVNVITVIAMLALTIVLALNAIAISENNQSLDELKDKRYLIAQISTANAFIVDKIDELYTQAVSIGDEDIIKQANEQYQILKNNISEIEAIDNGDDKAQLQQFKNTLSKYNKVAEEIVRDFISGDVDFAVIQEKSQIKTELFEQITTGLEQYKNKMDSEYV